VKQRAGIENARIRDARVLSVNTNAEDGVSLEHIFHGSGWNDSNADWALVTRATFDSALAVLRDTSIPIVLCDCNLMPDSWREMLRHISAFPDPPLFIVTARLADERLWAEALNLGAYDVLATPFDATEVVRTLRSVWQCWQDRHGVHRSRTERRKAATAE
jgi:DNA-binding response OmpR family regulator